MIQNSTERGTRMNVKKYIGMDVHQETISIADLGSDAGSRGGVRLPTAR
jgi:hypothetical protein